MADFTVSGKVLLDTSDLEQGGQRAQQVEQQLGEATRRRNQYDVEASATATRAAAEAATAAQRSVTANNDAASRAEANARSQAAAIAASTSAATANAAAIRTQGQAVEEAGGKLTAYQKQQLSFQLNDLAVQIGSGQGVFRPLLQQGTQITQIFGGVGQTIARIPVVAGLAAGAILAFAGAFAHITSVGNEAIQRQRQFSIELTATGNAAGMTAAQLEKLVQSEAGRAGAGRADTAAALSGLLLNPGLDSDQLARTLALARDFARITGQDLPAAAQTLSGALDGSSAAVRKLDQSYNFLSAEQLEQIRKFEEQGNRTAAIGVALGAMETAFKGANERGISPAAKGLADLGAAWATFENRLANSAFIQKVLSGTGATLQAAAGAIAAATPAAGPSAADAVQAKASLDAAEASLARLRQQRAAIDKASPGGEVAAGYADAAIAQAEKRVADLKSNLSYVQQEVLKSGVNTAAAQAQSETQAAATRFKDDLKRYEEGVVAFHTLTQQRSALETQVGNIEQRLKLGGLSPEALVASQEQLSKLKGDLYNLASPAEVLQKQLDVSGALAKLPPNLREVEQAWRSTFDAAMQATNGDVVEARRMADQARATALTQQNTATQLQITLLSEEARGALAVAAAYGQSQAAGLRAAAQAAAAAAEATGAIAPGTAGAVAQENLEKAAASAVAAAAEKNRAYVEEVAGLQRLVVAEGISAEAAREAERVNKVATLAVTLRAQAAASGSAAIAAAAEREIAVYDRLSQQQLVLERQRAAQQLNRQFDPGVNYAQQVAQLKQLEATGLLTARTVAEASKRYELEKLEASRNATDGMVGGLMRYADEAMNAGKAAGDGIRSGMKTAEDALVQFVTTGQISFTNLANSIIADLARIAIRQSITGPIAAGLSSALGSLGGIFSGWFGSSNSGGYATVGSGAGSTNGQPNFTGMHSGGIVGRDATFTRAVDPMLFANAPRFHTGGVAGLAPNERAIIALDDEEVLTVDDPRHRRNLGRASNDGGSLAGIPGKIEINVINRTDGTARVKKTPTANGGMRYDVIVEQLQQRIGTDIAQQRGDVFNATRDVFGLRPVGRG